MGCNESSLLISEETTSKKTKTTVDTASKTARKTLNMTFSNFVKNSTKKVFEEYQFTAWISKSKNSIVRWAWHRRGNTERVVKIIKRTNESEIRAMREIDCLRALDHPNIVKLYEYFIDQEYIYLILEPVYGKNIYSPILGV